MTAFTVGSFRTVEGGGFCGIRLRESFHEGAERAEADHSAGKSGPHRYTDRGHRFAAFKLCGAAEGAPRRASGVAEKGDLRAGGRTEDACHPQNISQMGA